MCNNIKDVCLLVTAQCTDESGKNDSRIGGPRVDHNFHALWAHGPTKDCCTATAIFSGAHFMEAVRSNYNMEILDIITKYLK